MAQPAQFPNNIIYILFIILLSNCSEKENQKENSGYLNIDSIYVKTTMGLTYVNNHAYSGILYSLFPNGKDTFLIKNFKNGMESGTWKQFYRNNKVKEIRYYENGKKTGQYLSWWENGNRKRECYFANDEYEGCLKEWSPQGNLIKEMNYHAGHEDGSQKVWYENGKIKSNYTIIKGRRYGLLGTKNCMNVSDSIFRK